MTETAGFLPKILKLPNVTTSWFARTQPRSRAVSSTNSSFYEATDKIIAVSKRCVTSRQFAKILPPIRPVMTLTYGRLETDYPILYANSKLQEMHSSHWNLKKPQGQLNIEVQNEVKSHLKKEFNKKKKRYKKERIIDEEKLLNLKLQRSSMKDKTKVITAV